MVDSSELGPGENLWKAAPPKPGEFVLSGSLDEDVIRFLTQTESWSGSPIFTLEADGSRTVLEPTDVNASATEVHQPSVDSITAKDGWSAAATSLVAVPQRAPSLDSAASASVGIYEQVDSSALLPVSDTRFYLTADVPFL